ncbi:tail fiber domain-containing protein [Spirosoma endophyticum]|uniref:Head domain of trimeric autotransporter adhesin n=1 Tax=Spirosoma endophyticum TaxID=662367 RepID=A0A1I2GZ54_9BACT|nr:tail fiber domain-containing protein [Spirosoma endophyticum]SFF22430.1 Head domain of trimeric autotransporter adhesin [Spirosoma endophyticum]
MKQIFLFTLALLGSTTLQAQVGIGTTTPNAFFNVADGKDVLFGQTLSWQVEDDDSDRSKLIWYASKGAFRAGNVSYTKWDIAQVGNSSMALGSNNVASGNNSVAIGTGSTASGSLAIVVGRTNIASGFHAMAMGENLTSSGNNSVALGNNNTASGPSAIVIGQFSTASGNNSVALGSGVSTNGKTGSFILGDFAQNNSSLASYANTAFNQMMMRFEGGYMLYTTAPANQTSAIGVRVGAGSNAWQTISDSTRKENFRFANGADFLQKISQMRLGSWNYKGQDVKQYRHYGPMAQDFFAAFGHDELGVIGEDKSINQADFDGVNLIAIQALIRENQELKAKLATFEEREKSIQSRLDKIEALLTDPSTASSHSLKP